MTCVVLWNFLLLFKNMKTMLDYDVFPDFISANTSADKGNRLSEWELIENYKDLGTVESEK